jgi:hypothetical protein
VPPRGQPDGAAEQADADDGELPKLHGRKDNEWKFIRELLNRGIENRLHAPAQFNDATIHDSTAPPRGGQAGIHDSLRLQ